MQPIGLHEFHQELTARFTGLNGMEAVSDYGCVAKEHAALRETAGMIDLSFRGRICLTGADRVRFLHGQVTNDIKKLHVGQGCYAALVTAKGRMQSDLNIFCLADELLLDFEPGLAAAIAERLEKYIVSDDVQVVEVASQYGLLSILGPKANSVVMALGLLEEIPKEPFQFCKASDQTLGEIYLANHPRLASAGFDLFIPVDSMAAVADKLIAAAREAGGCACGWQAFDMVRIEAGIPRFGVDMDESHFPLESGIESRAVSYSKGCYIGQEVINRIHTIGHVNRELRGLLLADDLKALPMKGDKLFRDGKETGHVTSAIKSPVLGGNIALGYVRREAAAKGTELNLLSAGVESLATVTILPFC